MSAARSKAYEEYIESIRPLIGDDPAKLATAKTFFVAGWNARKLAEFTAASRGIDELHPLTLSLLKTLRDSGWAVAVMNDYMLQGKRHVFWLFTKTFSKGDRRFVRGEGETDLMALGCIHAQLDAEGGW